MAQLLIHLDDVSNAACPDYLASRQLLGASMARYRSQTFEVDAQPYVAGLEDEWAHAWWYGVLSGRYPTKQAADDCPNRTTPGCCGRSVPVLVTRRGRVELASGDWIVTTSDGERQIWKADAFEASYELCSTMG